MIKIPRANRGVTSKKQGSRELTQYHDHVPAFQSWLRAEGYDGFIIPRGDEFQGENVACCDERLRWLTGFDGSAGYALVTRDQAAVFVDGRYRLQVRQQIDTTRIFPRNLDDGALSATLHQFLPHGGVIGFDPWLHTMEWSRRVREHPDFVSWVWKAATVNPVDAMWHDRPVRPHQPAYVWQRNYSGQTISQKIVAIREVLEKSGNTDADVLVSHPDQLAWMLNIRGHDVDYTPLFLARAVLSSDGNIMLFADPGRVGDDVRHHFRTEYPDFSIEIKNPSEITEYKWKKVFVDPAKTPVALSIAIEQAGGRIVTGKNPIDVLKARTNPTELSGMRQAHRRDAVAMIAFLHWMDEQVPKLPDHPVTEMDIADKLLSLRQAQADFVMPSFATIAGYGPNGAIVHYRANPASNVRLLPGQLLLVDSGGQYRDGTTDITRTICLGEPAAIMKYHYTLVLRGHARIASGLFPPGTNGAQLDALARQPLWQNGLDYDHGTGHGVGCFLGVHDGPQRISKVATGTPLEPGMILSIEPGYYLPEHYGIRLENLVVVSEMPIMHETTQSPMLCFEPLTMVPFSRALIANHLMSVHEIRWVDDYHAMVRQTMMDLMPDTETRAWLERATAPL